MRVNKLVVKNIGMVADAEILLNKPLILFYGDIRAGKTTLLNSVRWVCGGSFPSDIIRHGQKEAHIELSFDGGSIRREFYVGKDGTTKAREITFIQGGKPVKNPVSEIKRFLNPFLLDQDYLRNMPELQRKAYFTELLEVDTSALDDEADQCETDARDLRAKIKGYGDIDLTETKPIDATALRDLLTTTRTNAADRANDIETQLKVISDSVSEANDAIDEYNRGVKDHNAEVARELSSLDQMNLDINEAEKRLATLRASRDQSQKWIADNPRKIEKQRGDMPDVSELQTELASARSPDTAELESRISEAGRINFLAERYQANVVRASARDNDNKRVLELERRQREIKIEKAAKLKTVAGSSGIAGLAFDDAGNFTYQGCQAGMLSTSQIMQLSSELSALYPEGFGIELLDRGESLGKSIFEFIDRAKKEDKTILATIVGERPAQVPECVGVFVVQAGSVGAQ